MQLFYSTHIENDLIYLDENDSRHAIKALRLNSGDVLQIVDGKGHLYKAEITIAHAKKTECRIIETKKPSSLPYYLHLAIAPTKNIDRLEWFLEKATEIGVSEITFLNCHHSERKVIKIERLERIVVSAMKQSLKAQKPLLNPLTSFKDFVEKENLGQKLIAHCEEEEKTTLKNLGTELNHITILIGPEGDFSPNEIELATANRFTPLSLGSSRLRTETAGVVAVSGVYQNFN